MLIIKQQVESFRSECVNYQTTSRKFSSLFMMPMSLKIVENEVVLLLFCCCGCCCRCCCCCNCCFGIGLLFIVVVFVCLFMLLPLFLEVGLGGVFWGVLFVLLLG